MGNSFETDKNYNYEKDVSMILNINKTCYCMGEFIIGNITLLAKNSLTQTHY